jgi:glycosyltransferase involved in cell wall biosynthesis
VKFIPFVADIEQVYNGGLFFAVTTVSQLGGPESFSRVIIESWAHGKPAVAFACGGPKHLIADGEDGFLIEEGNVEQLADRMRRLLADPALRERMGEKGCAKVREKYVPEKVASLLLSRLLAAPQP